MSYESSLKKVKATKDGVESGSATSLVQAVLSTQGSLHASKPRIDALNNLILEFIEINKCPPWNSDTEARLITYLKNLQGHGIIVDVVEVKTEEDEEGIYLKGVDEPTSFKALRGRYYRMRDKYNKSR